MSYVFTVAIVSGLFYLSSSCVLCVHCCYCLWFVLFFIVLCLMCSLLLLSLVCFIFHRPVSYVFTVAIVSGLFYFSSSCVLCVHCCYCLWFVLFFIFLCLMCSLLLLSLVCFIFHRRVSYVFTVAIVSGLFYFSSSCVLCVHCCYCLWFVLFFIVLCLMCSLLLLSLVCFIFHRPVSCVFTVAIVSELFNCDYLYDFFITFMFLFRHFGFIAPKTLNYLTFDFERT